jgi:hypothetical protein
MGSTVPSSLYHFINLFSAKTGLITVSAAAIPSPSLPSGSSMIATSTRLVHNHPLAQKFLSVQALNGRLSLRLRRHFYKTKPSGLATVLVFDHSR